MSQQGVCPQEAEADVGGLGEVPKHWRIGEVHGPGPAVHQGHHNLTKGGASENSQSDNAHHVLEQTRQSRGVKNKKNHKITFLYVFGTFCSRHNV